MRLPLLRFKSVCKSWVSLMESSSFFTNPPITTANFSSSSKFGSFIFHAAVSKRIPSSRLLRENAVIMLSSKSESESFFGSSSPGSGSGCWCWVTSGQWSTWRNDDDYQVENSDDYDDDDQVFNIDDQQQQQLVFKLDNLGFPSDYKFTNTSRVIGSCNGLICLVDGGRFNYGVHLDYSLWNPATKQFRILPKSIPIENEIKDALGLQYSTAFGFDVETKDYKVVLVTGFSWNGIYPMDCSCRVQVYSLSTDSWRLLEDITSLPGYLFLESSEGLYLNGSCFFMATQIHTAQYMCFPKNDRLIISFDLTKEVITTIDIPDHDRNQKLYLSYMGEKLAIFKVVSSQLTMEDVNNSDLEIDLHDDFEIWVLNEHAGNTKESWTKLHSFRIENGEGEFTIPIGISNDGEFAILQTLHVMDILSKKMKLYNLVTNEVTKNFLCCNAVQSPAPYVYKPSLVSIIGGNGAGAAAVIGRG